MGVDFCGRAQARVTQLRLSSFQRFSKVAEQSGVRVPETVPSNWRQAQAVARWSDATPENVLRIERSCPPQKFREPLKVPTQNR